MSESPNDQKIAAEWIKVIEDPSSQHIREKDIYPRLAKWVETVAPTRILEIGSGQGICSTRINLEGRSYTGLEPSTLLLERSQQLYKDKNKRFVFGTSEDLPFEDFSFDAVFSIVVWHLLPNIEAATKELARVLDSGGTFLIISANPDAYSLWTKTYENTSIEEFKFKGEIKLSDGSVVTETLFLHGRDTILNSLQHAGLSVDRVDVFREVDQHQRFIQIEGRKIGKM